MSDFYRSNGASAGRGNYGASLSAGALIAETRKLLQELLHCQAKQVVFTPTAKSEYIAKVGSGPATGYVKI